MVESDGEASSGAKKSCKYCKKNVTSGQNCKICKVTYHHSCAQRVKICCGHLIQGKINLEDSDAHNSEEAFLREENLLLRQIIKDKESIIMDKGTLITLLNNKIKNLEEKLEITEEKQKTINKNSTNTVLIPGKNIYDKDTDTLPTTQNNEEKHINPEKLQNKQIKIMEHIINLNNEDSHVNSPQENEAYFQKVGYKKKNKKQKVHIGEAEISKEEETHGFVGRAKTEKKIWLFISRVKDHVTEEIVKNYLGKKTSNNSDIYVKEIDTYKKSKDNRCFKVGLNFNLKELAYTSSFWPKGVAVCRYDFKKEEKYLNRLRSIDTESENFPKEPQQADHFDELKEQDSQANITKTHPFEEENQNFLEKSKLKKKNP